MRAKMELDEAFVVIYSKNEENAYAFYNNRASKENNTLDSCEIHGGENDPFEYIKLRIPRKKMSQIAPELMEPNAIVAGINKVYVNAMGAGTYIVASSDLTGDTCVITAYCRAYKLTSTSLTGKVEGTPFELIEDILTTATYGQQIAGKLKYWYIPRDETSDRLIFEKGTLLWYVLQVCALYLGCKIFFAGEDAYLVDYRIPAGKTVTSGTAITSATDSDTGLRFTVEKKYGKDGKYEDGQYIADAIYDFDTIDLYTKESNRPEYARCLGSVKQGNEGLTTVINRVCVKCANNVETTVQSNIAIKQYDNSVLLKQMTIEELKETDQQPNADVETWYHQGSIVASNILDYRCESQQSVQFTLKEYIQSEGKTYWVPFFPPSSRLRALKDDIDDINVSNTSVLNDTIIKPQKLILSSYTRNFPDGTSTYKFGVISSVDLSQKLSDMTAAQQ